MGNCHPERVLWSHAIYNLLQVVKVRLLFIHCLYTYERKHCKTKKPKTHKSNLDQIQKNWIQALGYLEEDTQPSSQCISIGTDRRLVMKKRRHWIDKSPVVRLCFSHIRKRWNSVQNSIIEVHWRSWYVRCSESSAILQTHNAWKW